MLWEYKASAKDRRSPEACPRGSIHLHLVWAVRGRQDRITDAFEAAVYRCITSEATGLGCLILALGGMPDHVHLLVRLPSKVAPALLAQQVKGASSRLMNTLRPDMTERFDWQPGYGCFSLGRNQCQTIQKYIENQKQHDSENNLWPVWEQTDEPETP